MKRSTILRLSAFTVAGAAVAAAVIHAPAANAGPADRAFIDALDEQGIPYSSRGAAITAGHHTCDLFRTGHSFLGVVGDLHEQSGFSVDDSAYFIGASVGAYCPQYLGLFADDTKAA